MSFPFHRRSAILWHHALFLFIVFAAVAGWSQNHCAVPICSYFQGDFYTSVAAADSLTAVAIGRKPFPGGTAMRRSTDGGRTWKSVELPFVEGLRKIRFASSTLGFIAGEKGALWRTTDAGATWTAGSIGGSDDLSKIDFVDTSTGFILGANAQGSVLYKTVDAGASWTPFPLARARLTSIDFIDASNGYGVGGAAAYRTRDGGSTWDSLRIWHALPYSIYPPNLFEAAFHNTLRGAVVGAGPVIVPTRNGGISWDAGSLKGVNSIDGARAALWAGPEDLVVADDEGYVRLARGAPADWIRIYAASTALQDLAMLRSGAYLVVGRHIIARVDAPGPTRLRRVVPISRLAEPEGPIFVESWFFPSQGLWRNLQGRGCPDRVNRPRQGQ